MEIRNAVIESAVLEIHEGGFLTVWITLHYGGGLCQGFGGHMLDNPKRPKSKSVAGHFIRRIMEVAGAATWKEVAGKPVRVKCLLEGANEVVSDVGHFINDDWFCPVADFLEIT